MGGYRARSNPYQSVLKGVGAVMTDTGTMKLLTLTCSVLALVTAGPGGVKLVALIA